MATSDFLDWAQRQWGQATFGDARRTQRAVRLGAALAAQPEASLPAQAGNWADLKAAYRLLAHPEVTHAALTAPHRESLARRAGALPGVVLFIQDTTELDYSGHEQTRGLGHIGDGGGTGLLVHSCLAVVPCQEMPQLLGLAAQQVWTREAARRGCETRAQRAGRRTESDVWAEVVEQIGAAPWTGETLWVSVGDRCRASAT